MKRCLIDINDAGIRISDAGGVLRTSPGFAFLEQGKLLTGEQAAARLRTNPRAGSDRFWHQLSQTPLPRPLGPARTHADLAWYHLRELWTPLADAYDEVLFSVGGDHDAERLSTLLGIARACDMPVRAVVSAAAAAAASYWQNLATRTVADLVCVDVQRYRVLFEPVRFHADRVGADNVDPGMNSASAGQGLAVLYDRWAQMIAEAFLQRTRFDPLHSAHSEQQLYDALPVWLRQLREQPRTALQLHSGGHDFVIELVREQFSAAVEDLYAPLLDMAAGYGRPMLLRERLTLLPGLVDRLRERQQVHIITDDMVSSHVLQIAESLISADDDAVSHHPSLQLAVDQADAKTPPAAADETLVPTHLSDGKLLWALGTDGLSLPPPAPGQAALIDCPRLQRHSDGRIVLQPGAASRNALLLINEEPLRPDTEKRWQHLSAGDHISLGEQRFMLLRLVP